MPGSCVLAMRKEAIELGRCLKLSQSTLLAEVLREETAPLEVAFLCNCTCKSKNMNKAAWMPAVKEESVAPSSAAHGRLWRVLWSKTLHVE